MSCGDHRIQERMPEPRAFCFGYLCLPAVYIYIIRIGEWYTYVVQTHRGRGGWGGPGERVTCSCFSCARDRYFIFFKSRLSIFFISVELFDSPNKSHSAIPEPTRPSTILCSLAKRASLLALISGPQQILCIQATAPPSKPPHHLDL